MANKEISLHDDVLLKESLLIVTTMVKNLYERVLEPEENDLVLLADEFPKIQLDKKTYTREKIKSVRNMLIEGKKEVKRLKGDIQDLSKLEDSIKESLAAWSYIYL